MLLELPPQGFFLLAFATVAFLLVHDGLPCKIKAGTRGHRLHCSAALAACVSSGGNGWCSRSPASALPSPRPSPASGRGRKTGLTAALHGRGHGPLAVHTL